VVTVHDDLVTVPAVGIGDEVLAYGPDVLDGVARANRHVPCYQALRGEAGNDWLVSIPG
jgi:hypothetical protein